LGLVSAQALLQQLPVTPPQKKSAYNSNGFTNFNLPAITPPLSKVTKLMKGLR
jgi:hypothetical protein